MDLEQYRTMEIFRSLRPDALQVLIETSETVMLDDEEKLFEQGDEAEPHLYVILAGKIQIMKNMRNKMEDVALLERGEHFGEFGLFGGGRRMATPVARGSAELLCVSESAIDELRDQQPESLTKLYENMLGILSGRFRAMAEKAERTQFWL